MEGPIISPAIPEKHKVDQLALVGPGMEVYDRAGKKVGKIDSLFAGSSEVLPGEKVVVPAPVAAGGQPIVPLAVPIIDPVAPATSPVKVPELDSALYTGDDMPKELRERLAQDGFIRIDAGLFRHHRYALREQIDRVEGERVVLNVPEAELIKH